MQARLASLVALVVLTAALLVPALPSAAAAPASRAAMPLGGPHVPIVITSDAGFNATNGVTGGSGTALDPYRISDWYIDASGGVGIAISDTSAYFVLDGVVVRFFPETPVSYVAAITLATDHGTVTGAQVDSGYYGIHLYGTDLHVRDSTIRAGVYGIFVYATNASVERNRIEISPRASTYRDAVRVFWGRNVTVAGNVGLGGGIEYICTAGGRIEGNWINGTWIQMHSSRGVTILHNNVFASAAWDIVYWDDHGMSCGWAPGNNTWDGGYPVGGNYFSGYAGVDDCSGPFQDICTGGDGIGDTPAPISSYPPVPPGNFTDRYPLTRPWLGPPADSIVYAFFGNATSGWGFSPETITQPGPHLYGIAGAPCELVLTANDTLNHQWYLDLNGNDIPDAGEPWSPFFYSTLPLVWTFTPPYAGNFTYRDAIFPASMSGTFTALPGTAPYAALTITPRLGNLTTVFTANASASRNETGGTGGLSFRWDWDGNGTWDTDWSSDPVATHVYLDGGWYLVRVEVRSALGGTETAMEWASVDDMAPVTDIAFEGQQGNAGWYRSPVTVTLTVHDAFLDAFPPMYRIDGGLWAGDSGPFTIGWDGNHTIEYQATDSTGHIEPIQRATVKVDRYGPDIVPHVPNGPLPAGDVSFSWSGTDFASGVAGYRITIDAAAPIDEGLATEMTVPFSAGEHIIQVVAIDGAGNEAIANCPLTVVAPSPPVDLLVVGATAAAVGIAAVLAAVFVLQRRRAKPPPGNP